MNPTLSIFLICLLLTGIFAFLTSCNPLTNTNKESSGKLEYGFSKSGDSILYNNILLEEVDAASFIQLDEHYCKDQNHVFYHDAYRESRDYFLSKKYKIQKLEADAASFISLGYGFAKDKLKAYNKGQSFEVADITRLTAIDHQFVKDGKHAYFLGKEIKGSDGNTFERIDAYYAKDANHYYYIKTDQVTYTIENILCNHPTFKILEYPYALDHEHVFFHGKIITGCHAGSFQIIKYPYAKDKEYVYYENQILKGADPLSFELFKENELSTGETYYAKDKNTIYLNNKPFPGAEASSFQILDEKYTMDKNGIYYKMHKVKNAAPSSFKVYPHYMGDADSEDKNHKYGDGKIVE